MRKLHYQSANPMRCPTPIVCTGNMLVGIAAGYLLFHPQQSSVPEHTAELRFPTPTQRPNATSFRTQSRVPQDSASPDALDIDAGPDSVIVDWDSGRANLPIAFLEQLDVTPFATSRHSPWSAHSAPFSITDEFAALLQLDQSKRDAVQSVLTEARRRFSAPRWEHPLSATQQDDGVLIELAPTPPFMEEHIRQDLTTILGEARAAFFLKMSQHTLDWEFGRFGQTRQIVEVSILPDNSLAIRETLRSKKETPAGSDTSATPEFEIRSRHHRVEVLPEMLATLVQIEGTTE